MATIIIGSARRDEHGKYTNGKAGDSLQTSSTNDTIGEVSMQNYYLHSKGWYLFRPISVEVANKIAQAMKDACNNKYIGYDQNDRLDIMTAIKKYGSMKAIKEPTECDCSSLVRACIYEATGVDVGNFNTSSQPKVLENSKLFEAKISVTSSTTIHDGDILVTKTKGHTVAGISGNPRKVTTSSTTTSSKKKVTYRVRKSWKNAASQIGAYTNLENAKKACKDGYYVFDDNGKVVYPKTNTSTQSSSTTSTNTTTSKTEVFKLETLKLGSKGNDVAIFETIMTKLGFYTGKIDSDFGPKCLAACNDFQKKYPDCGTNGKPDNTFGSKCWSKALSLLK
jgi:hypothetical protein